MRRLKKMLGAVAVCAAMGTASASAAVMTIQTNFHDAGNPTSLANWNNVESDNAGAFIADLVDSNGNSTGISLTMDAENSLAGGNNTPSTPLSGDAAAYFPEEVADTYGWGSKDQGFSGGPYPLAEITLSGLNTNLLYDFTLLAWREDGSGGREGTFTFEGANSSSIVIDGAHDGSQVGKMLGITPNANGEILLTIEREDFGAGYFYLNGMVIDVVPEPSTLGLAALGGLALLGRRRK